MSFSEISPTNTGFASSTQSTQKNNSKAITTTNVSPSFAEQIATSRLVLKDTDTDVAPPIKFSASKYLLSGNITRGSRPEEVSSWQKTIASLVLPALKIHKERLTRSRNQFMQGPNIVDRIGIKTADDVILDCFCIIHPRQLDFPPEEQKWILFLNGNAVPYEQNLPNLAKLSEDLGINILTGNYRGVGCSEGFPTSTKDLVHDAEAMVQYLLDKGILTSNILVHGWSLGGAVALKIASHHPVNICHDRSFSKIENVLLQMLPIGLSHLATGYLMTSNWSFGNLTEHYLSLKGRKFFIYCPEDGIIPPQTSLFYTLDKTHAAGGIIINQLKAPTLQNVSQDPTWLSQIVAAPSEYQQYCHNVPITKCGPYYDEYLMRTKKLLNIT